MELDKALADLLKKEHIFHQMFDVIRLVEQNGHYVCQAQSDGSCQITDETCFSVWGKKHRCSNCVSRRAYDDEQQHVKFEFANEHYYFVIARPVTLQGKKYVLELVMDVTNQFTQSDPAEGNFVMNLIHELERVSSQDPFSGLYNKKRLHKALRKALEQCQKTNAQRPLYLSIWDIDRFKQVNDTYGHDAGDRVLLSVAHALKTGINKQEGLVARFGGDEFAILFYETDPQKCEAKLAAIKKAIDAQTYALRLCNETSCIHVSISYGLADVHTAADPEAAIHLADQHLYDKKHQVHRND